LSRLLELLLDSAGTGQNELLVSDEESPGPFDRSQPRRIIHTQRTSDPVELYSLTARGVGQGTILSRQFWISILIIMW